MIEVNIKKRIKTYSGTDYFEVKADFPTESTTKIFGPSGSGKTTLLKILAGFTAPDEGYIRVNKKIWLDTNDKVNIPVQQRSVGFVFQDYALFPNMTVEQHLKYGTSDNLFIDRLLSIGQLNNFKIHKPKQLSGGQQQRLAILRALATKPKILLMDEPFSALDSSLKLALIADLKVLISEYQMTCLVVTHHPLETEGFADNSYEFS